jgi:hypothetical protein
MNPSRYAGMHIWPGASFMAPFVDHPYSMGTCLEPDILSLGSQECSSSPEHDISNLDDDPVQLLPHDLLTISPPKHPYPRLHGLGLTDSNANDPSSSSSSYNITVPYLPYYQTTAEFVPAEEFAPAAELAPAGEVGAVGQLPASWVSREPRYELRVPGDSWPPNVNSSDLLRREFPEDTVLNLQKPSISG